MPRHALPSIRSSLLGSSLIDAIATEASRAGAIDLAAGAMRIGGAMRSPMRGRCRLDGGSRYSSPAGELALRKSISSAYWRRFGIAVDADRETTVTCGATEGLIATVLAVTDPADEVVVLEPAYDGFFAALSLAGVRARPVPLHPPDWAIDWTELRGALSGGARALIVNSPHNPTGKALSDQELRRIVAVCRDADAICICDEVYDAMVFDGRSHVSLLHITDARDRAIVLGSVSKTFAAAGWRIGYVVAPAPITEAVRAVHERLAFSAALPMQEAAVAAFSQPVRYYEAISCELAHCRDLLVDALADAGLTCSIPAGAMYVFADISAAMCGGDREFARHVLDDLGIAAVPGRAFYADPSRERTHVRFCFARPNSVLNDAIDRLAGVPTL